MNEGNWKVERIEVWEKLVGRPPEHQAHAYYHFHVHGKNHSRVELGEPVTDFSWLVPDINSAQFDLMDATWGPGAAALAATLYGLAFLQERTRGT